MKPVQTTSKGEAQIDAIKLTGLSNLVPVAGVPNFSVSTASTTSNSVPNAKKVEEKCRSGI